MSCGLVINQTKWINHIWKHTPHHTSRNASMREWRVSQLTHAKVNGKRRRRHEIMTWKLTILFLLNLLNEQMNISSELCELCELCVCTPSVRLCVETYACTYFMHSLTSERAGNETWMSAWRTQWLTDWLTGWLTRTVTNRVTLQSAVKVWISHGHPRRMGGGVPSVCAAMIFFDLHRRKCSWPKAAARKTAYKPIIYEDGEMHVLWPNRSQR